MNNVSPHENNNLGLNLFKINTIFMSHSEKHAENFK